jgi:hypothetical protein
MLESVLTEALETSHIELAPYKPTAAEQGLMLCAIRTNRPAGFEKAAVLDASVPHTGELVALLPSGFFTAARWEFNPVIRGRYRNHVGQAVPAGAQSIHAIVRHPSIVPIQRMECLCPECGHVSVESRSEIRRRIRTPQGKRVHRFEPGMKVPCTAPGCTCKAVQLTKLTTTATYTNRFSDPVMESITDGLAADMKAYAEKNPRPNGATLMLPRVWAVYARPAVPDQSWQPEDRYAEALDESAAKGVKDVGPAGILPYKVARPYHTSKPISGGLVKVFVDAAPQIGWIDPAQLMLDAEQSREQHGWHRQFVFAD